MKILSSFIIALVSGFYSESNFEYPSYILQCEFIGFSTLFLSSTRLTLWVWTPVKYIIVHLWAQAHSMHREQFVFVDFNNLVYRAKWLGHHNTTHQFSLSDTHANTHTHIILGYQECHVENSAFVQTKGILDFVLKLCGSGENAFGTQQM